MKYVYRNQSLEVGIDGTCWWFEENLSLPSTDVAIAEIDKEEDQRLRKLIELYTQWRDDPGEEKDWELIIPPNKEICQQKIDLINDYLKGRKTWTLTKVNKFKEDY